MPGALNKGIKGGVTVKLKSFDFVNVISYLHGREFYDIEEIKYKGEANETEYMMNGLVNHLKENLNVGVITSLIIDIEREKGYEIEYIDFKKYGREIKVYSNGEVKTKGVNVKGAVRQVKGILEGRLK